MRHDIHFNFDGKWSYDMGIVKVNVDGGLFDDQIISSKKIIEEKIEGRNRPYFYGVERDPLSFPLPVYFDENLTTKKMREILRWLDNDTYRPFYMADNPDRRWYVMVIDNTHIIHNGIKSGYLELTLRADDTTALTPFTFSEAFELRGNSQGTVIEVSNEGDFNCKPIVHITKVGNGDLTIQNLSYNTGNFTFTDLQNGEKLIVDCDNKDITTDFFTPRYNNFSNNYLTLKRGVNRLNVIGNCDLQFETEFRIY